MAGTWADNTVTIRSAAEVEALERTSLGVKLLYDTTLAGGTDESTAVQNAINAAIATGKRLVPDYRKSYLCGTKLTISGPLTIDGNGATIKKSATLNDYVIDVTGTDVQINDLNIGGNRAGGNTFNQGCVKWEAARGVARRVKVTNSAGLGILVRGSTAVLDAHDCECSDHVTGAFAGDGFFVDQGGVLRTHNCRGDNNDRNGCTFATTAGAGCHLDGTFNSNLKAVAQIFNSDGTGGRIYGSNNRNQGLYLSGSATCARWTFDHVEIVDSGQGLNGSYTPVSSATAIEVFGATGIHFSTIVARRNLGYGIAFVQDGLSVGASYMVVDHAYIENTGDPAVMCSGSAHHIAFGKLTVNGCTMALSVGEATPTQPCDHISFDVMDAWGCSYAVINHNGGRYNTVGRVKATDCTNHSPYTGLVSIDGANSHHFTIHTWESDNKASTPPVHIMTVDALAAHCWIAGGFARDFSGTALSDAGGSSRIDFATAP